MGKPKLPPPKGPVRYTYEAVAAEIERYMAREGRGTQTRLAVAVGMSPQDLRHKLDQYQGGRLTVEQVGAIAAEADGPLAWPWISWEKGEKLQTLQKALEQLRER